MTTINRKVLDLSHHNTIPSMDDFDRIKAAGILGIIHKATESTNYKDPTYPNRKSAFLERGFLWGAYHFVHPGNVEAQVDYFLAYAGVSNEMLYALDWEASSTGTMNESQAEQFMRLIEQKTGRKGVVYSGNVAKEQISGVNTYLGSCRLWLAQYGSTPTVQESWDDWWLWQYSDGKVGPQPHGCPGVTGYVDTNSWEGTDAELAAEWSGTGTAPPVDTPVVNITIQAPPGVIVNVIKL